MTTTVREIIELLKQHNTEANNDLARKLRKYAYTQEELEFIARQVRAGMEKKK